MMGLRADREGHFLTARMNDCSSIYIPLTGKCKNKDDNIDNDNDNDIDNDKDNDNDNDSSDNQNCQHE
eukprot:jgi/Psemu1/53846/gm1.53846_g